MENNDKEKKEAGGEDEAATPVDYLRAVRVQLKNRDGKAAYVLLQQALVYYPEDPLIRSYYGCLQSLVDKKYRTGVETCKKAFTLVTKETPGRQAMFGILYLNLGRALIASGKKKDAIDAFEKGLKYDKKNAELVNELRTLGMRKKPPIPFLSRSNLLNKYIGKLMHKSTSPSPAAARAKAK